MSVQLAILVATAVLAVVSVVAAVVAVRALREMRRLGDQVAANAGGTAHRDHVDPGETEPSLVPRETPDHVDEPELVRVVEGRVIVQPTQEQVVAATMTRSSVRLNILAAGLAHALRPESRDRITALMRREYRARRRERQCAARAASREWVGP